MELWYIIFGLDSGQVLTLTIKDAFAAMAEEVGITLCMFPKMSLFFVALDHYLVSLVTLEWLEDALEFLKPGVLDTV